MHLFYHWNRITGVFLDNKNRSTNLYLKLAMLVTQNFPVFLFFLKLEDLLNNEQFVAISDSLR